MYCIIRARAGSFFPPFYKEIQCVYQSLIYNQYEHQKVFGLVFSASVARCYISACSTASINN